MQSKPGTKALRLNVFQIVILILIGVNIVALILSTKVTSDGASKDNEVFSSIESMARSFSLLQRDTLVYTTKLAQWGAGDIPQSEVVIALVVLEQRLAQIREGKFVADQFPELTFFKVLEKSDGLVAAAGRGYLSDVEYVAVQPKLKEIIDSILNFSSKFAIIYREQLDQILKISAEDRKYKANANLFLLLIFTFLSIVFIATYFNRRNRHYQAIDNWLQAQLVSLNIAEVELKKSGSLIEKLRFLDERKNIFISTINHELRTPLTSIIGYVSLLRESVNTTLSTQGEHILDVIDRNSTMLLDIVEETLTLSSLESSSQDLEKEAVDVATIISDAILALTPAALGSNTVFVVDIEENLDTKIYANTTTMLQAISNILSNALKFSNGESEVRIKVSQRYDEKNIKFIQISVTDHGIGIPETQLNEIFTTFYRAPNAISKGIPGTGLGLAITLRIIELHQGTIKVESKVDIGSTFTLELPSQVSALEKMIKERRGGVLERAILAIETCTAADLEATCHEMMGALGFYNYESLGAEIKLFSDWLKAKDSLDSKEFSSRRVELLGKLRLRSNAENNLGGELKLEI